MAVMIPPKPYYFDEKSQEDLMFSALEKLPDDYYVFHSYRIYKEINKTLNESEIDFLIYNKHKGLLVIEAKSGQIRCHGGVWYYQNGTQMKHGGPFEQAIHNKWNIYNYIQSKPRVSYLTNKCRINSGVWLISFSKDDVIRQNFPADIDKKMIMTKESLLDPLEDIERIYSLKKYNDVDTNLNDIEHKDMIFKVLCPEFDIVPTKTFEADINKIVFHRLLNEQTMLLNYLTEQRSAIINGAAGTGKTLIAVQKALRHAESGDKVLFLCFNTNLRDDLENKYKNDNIDFLTISKYACRECGTSVADYYKLKDRLEKYFFDGNFPYNHIIVDEGQDFGNSAIEESKVMNLMRMIIESKNDSGSFYIFYDKLQLIQAHSLPDFISDADCKLTLYKNCRNTRNIAETSLRPIIERKTELFEGAIKGNPVKMHFCSNLDSEMNTLDSLINKFNAEGYKDIVILTVKTEETSFLSNKTCNGLYRNKYKFTTCRKFKGLEADVVILIDIDRNSFNVENRLLFYVGTSRARIELSIISSLSNEDCCYILNNELNVNKEIRNGKKELSSKLNAMPINNE